MSHKTGIEPMMAMSLSKIQRIAAAEYMPTNNLSTNELIQIICSRQRREQAFEECNKTHLFELWVLVDEELTRQNQPEFVSFGTAAREEITTEDDMLDRCRNVGGI